jgi:anaerobic selenocysteine-containing dehydrogenase
MTGYISRREFLKIFGLGSLVSAALAHNDPLLRYVGSQLYGRTPALPLTSGSTSFATTCGACSAGCGLLAQIIEGRLLRIQGNPDHPVNQGDTCTRAQASLEGLYSPYRLKGPLYQSPRGSGNLTAMDWEAAVGVVKESLQNSQPGGIAFLMGLFPDHLFDLIQMMANSAGRAGKAVSALRYATLAEFEGRVTLMDAAQKLFGVSKIPYFDVQHAEVIFSFGANFFETWISPVSYTRQYGEILRQRPGQRGYLVQFEPRRSQTAAAADEWVPVKPGTEVFVAAALARLVNELKYGASTQAASDLEVAEAVSESGVSEADLHRLARIFADAPRKLAIPGGIALGSANGLSAAEAILSLNILAENLGQDGGLFFTPDFLLNPALVHRPSSFAEINALVERMKSGQIKVLFIHGANPVYDLPAKLGFADALQSVPLVISFASFLDETAALADYVLPDHTPMESWGYQKVITGGDRLVVSGLQPVVEPVCDTRATADVLLSAVQALGGDLAAALPFQNEVDFLQKCTPSLIDQGGFYDEDDMFTFWSRWQQYGGWWKENARLSRPEGSKVFKSSPGIQPAHYAGDIQEYPLHLLIFPYSNPGESVGASSLMLKKAPEPETSTNGLIWVEINPLTARALGVRKDDIVKVTSPAGEIEAIVREDPAIIPDVVAVPLWQRYATPGYFAERRDSNPLNLLEINLNNSGNLAFMGTRVNVTPVDRPFLGGNISGTA